MRRSAPFIIMIALLAACVFSILGEDGYRKLVMLRRALAAQVEDNTQSMNELNALKRKVKGLRSDPRALEKSARNELGMARPDEMIFIFDSDKKKPSHDPKN